jgi:hypothetical protein
LWNDIPGKSVVHIVKHPEQVLPCCIIHLERDQKKEDQDSSGKNIKFHSSLHSL